MTTNEPPPYPGEPTPSTNDLPSYGSTPPPPAGSYPPPPPGGYPPAPGGYGGVPQQNKKALWSMILGIASLVLGVFCGFLAIGSIVAIVLGFIARGEISGSNGTQTGSGQALTGIITGFVLIALLILGIILIATGAIDYNFTTKT